MTQDVFARLLGAHVDTVRRWERGANRPKEVAIVEKFAQATGTDPQYAIRVAGLALSSAPGGFAPPRPEPEDPEIELIKKSSLPQHVKDGLIKENRRQAEDDKKRRIAYVEAIMNATGRRGLND